MGTRIAIGGGRQHALNPVRAPRIRRRRGIVHQDPRMEDAGVRQRTSLPDKISLDGCQSFVSGPPKTQEFDKC